MNWPKKSEATLKNLCLDTLGLRMGIEKGLLSFGEDFLISKDFTVKDLSRIERKYSIQQVIKNDDFESYKTKIINFFEKNIIATLYFKDDLIYNVGIYLTGSSNGWPLDTEEVERQKKIEQDVWLTTLLGGKPPYYFPWGHIESNHDQKSLSSVISITFNRNE